MADIPKQEYPQWSTFLLVFKHECHYMKGNEQGNKESHACLMGNTSKEKTLARKPTHRQAHARMINKTSTFQARRAAEAFIGYSEPPRNAGNFMQVPEQLLQDEVHQTSEASCMQECDEGTLSCWRRGAKPDNLYTRQTPTMQKRKWTQASVLTCFRLSLVEAPHAGAKVSAQTLDYYFSWPIILCIIAYSLKNF